MKLNSKDECTHHNISNIRIKEKAVSAEKDKEKCVEMSWENIENFHFKKKKEN